MRHNLSSNRAFKKAERGPDEKGKGALWTLDPLYEQSFEEAERKQALAALGNTGSKDGKASGKKGKGLPLESPFKRSIKGDNKGTPLPPPLTSVPLVPKSAVKTIPANPIASSSIKVEPASVEYVPPHGAPSSATTEASSSVPPQPPSSSSASPALPASAPSSAFPAIPASVRLPIVIGLVSSASSSNLSDATSATAPKPISLHENTLYLNPDIFSHLTPKHLQDLEALGAQKALEILQSYIVRYYKEKLKAEGSRGRGRGRPKRGRVTAGAGRGGATGAGRRGSTSDLFTSAPLPSRTNHASPVPLGPQVARPPMASLHPIPADDPADDTLIVVDDDSPDETPPTKRQRTDPPTAATAE